MSGSFSIPPIETESERKMTDTAIATIVFIFLELGKNKGYFI